MVLCPPLGREQFSAHATYRELGDELAGAGFTAIRFDYDGTGDSMGDDGDPNRVSSWLASIGHAVELARATGAAAVALVGLRMGALLAAVAGAELGDISALVLWDPCLSGRAFIREQRMLQMLHGDPTERADGSMELAGFLYRAQTVADLCALTLRKNPASGPIPALVLTRPDSAFPEALVSDVGLSPLQWEVASGQEELLDVEPLHSAVPQATVSKITKWLDAVMPVASYPARVPFEESALVGQCNGRTITERVVSLGPVGLFGIVAEPDTAPAGPTIVMLNSGVDWHVGPSRLWVLLSRRWAALGMRCVRIDLSGLGDSPSHPGRHRGVARAPEHFDDIEAVSSALVPEDPSDILWVGLCSGAYQALESALIRKPRGVYAINPRLQFTPPESHNGPTDPRRRIARSTTSLVRAYRGVPIPVSLRPWVRSIAWRWANRNGSDHSPARWLSELVDEGVDVLCVVGTDEARPFLEGTGAAIPALEATGRLHLEVIHGLDHALLGIDQREEVITLLSDHLTLHFAGEPVGCEVGPPPVALHAVSSAAQFLSPMDLQRSHA